MLTLFDISIVDLIKGVVIDLIKLGIAFLAGYFWAKIKIFKNYYLAKNIWRPFIAKSRQASVVLTTKPSPNHSGTPKVSLNEVQAFSEIRNTFSGLGADAKLVDDPSVDLEKLSDNHVISIGGPKFNNVSREILARVSNKYEILPFSYNEAAGCIETVNKRLESVIADDKSLATDYGMVIRVQGLNGKPMYSCLVAFGLRGLGTWGAVKALTADSDSMSKIDSQFGTKDFAMVLEFKFLENKLTHTKILAANMLVPTS